MPLLYTLPLFLYVVYAFIFKFSIRVKALKSLYLITTLAKTATFFLTQRFDGRKFHSPIRIILIAFSWCSRITTECQLRDWKTHKPMCQHNNLYKVGLDSKSVAGHAKMVSFLCYYGLQTIDLLGNSTFNRLCSDRKAITQQLRVIRKAIV
jgi:hypothetical protein